MATIVPNNTYGLGVANAAGQAFKAAGGKVVKSVAYAEGQPDYRADIESVIAAAPEAIISAGYGDNSRTIFKNARELGLDAPWYTAYPSIFTVENEKWMNGKLSGVDNGGYGNDPGKAVLAAYKAKWPKDGEPLAHIYYGYDAMKVLAAAMKKAGEDPEGDRRRAPQRRKRLCRHHRGHRVGRSRPAHRSQLDVICRSQERQVRNRRNAQVGAAPAPFHKSKHRRALARSGS